MKHSRTHVEVSHFKISFKHAQMFNLFFCFKVITSPPFCVKESGYGMFQIPIEVFFNGTNQTHKVDYYLQLQPPEHQRPLVRLKEESITFTSPNKEFRKNLLEYGGVISLVDSIEPQSTSSNKESTSDHVLEETIKKTKKANITIFL
jgi:transcription initiation factor IIF auxiliary subunit